MKMPKKLTTLALLCYATAAAAQGSYDDLVKLDAEIVTFAKPKVTQGVPDLSPEAIEAQKQNLQAYKAKLGAFDTSAWPVDRRIDYLLVWTKINTVEFDHRVMKPWARDPILYLEQVRALPWAPLPIPSDKKAAWAEQLKAVPAMMTQAQSNLTEAKGELAKLTLFHLDNFDGVGQRQPHRDDNPAGTIGWYTELCVKLKQHHPELVKDCNRARTAVIGYRDFLKKNLGSMTQSAAIGTENMNWYLAHVKLIPNTVDQLMLLGEREFHRYRFDYLVDRNRNAALPELTLSKSAADHEAKTRDAEARIRKILADQKLLKIPGYMPDEFESDVYWSKRSETEPHFWERLQYRNSLDNHIHASVPGHRFDHLMWKRLTHPIRKTVSDQTRKEGWGTYLEELLLQAGITDDNPRAREIFYIALIKRGSRFYAEMAMHSGQMTLDQANEYMIQWVPFMEVNLGRYDLANYLRRPGAGSMYLYGKNQIEQLISERAYELGDKFNLGEFHEAFLSKGVIPVTLIRWDMTGHDEDVARLWPVVTGQAFAKK